MNGVVYLNYKGEFLRQAEISSHGPGPKYKYDWVVQLKCATVFSPGRKPKIEGIVAELKATETRNVVLQCEPEKDQVVGM